jgi:hypothetical protein
LNLNKNILKLEVSVNDTGIVDALESFDKLNEQEFGNSLRKCATLRSDSLSDKPKTLLISQDINKLNAAGQALHSIKNLKFSTESLEEAFLTNETGAHALDAVYSSVLGVEERPSDVHNADHPGRNEPPKLIVN